MIDRTAGTRTSTKNLGQWESKEIETSQFKKGSQRKEKWRDNALQAKGGRKEKRILFLKEKAPYFLQGGFVQECKKKEEEPKPP